MGTEGKTHAQIFLYNGKWLIHIMGITNSIHEFLENFLVNFYSSSSSREEHAKNSNTKARIER